MTAIDLANPPYSLEMARTIGHFKWLRRGIRTRLVRMMLPREVYDSAQFEINLYGYRYCGLLANWIDSNLYLFGEYEEEIQHLLRSLSSGGRAGVFVDVGANVGVHSLFASQHFQYVHAFEPFPFVHDRLVALLEQNQIRNVTVHNVALGDSGAELPFFAPTEANYGTGSFLGDYSESNTPFGNLTVAKGDEYFSGRIRSIDVIKIDVEGYEIEVLRGLRETLRSYRPDVIVEMSDMTWRRLGGVSGLLELLPESYELFHIQSRQVFAFVFERPTVGLKPLGLLRPGANVLAAGAERMASLQASGLLTAAVVS